MDYKENFDTLSGFLSTANQIKSDYNHPQTNVRVYKFNDIHDDMKKKYWSKHSVEKLSKNFAGYARNTSDLSMLNQ